MTVSARRPSKGEINRAGRHLAARLQAVRAGSRQLLVDLEDETDLRARELVEWWRDEHLAPMDETRRIVARMCPPNLLPGESVVSVASRAKRFTTIVDKLLREPVKLADMADVGGVRAVVDSRAEVDTLVEQLNEELAVRRVRDWARQPRASGYRAVHLHVRQAERMIEVQVRTVGQDAWANLVEDESRYAEVNYKAGQGRAEVLHFLRLVADQIASAELGETEHGLQARLAAAQRVADPFIRSPRLRSLRS